MEPAFTDLHGASVFIGLANLELEIAVTLKVCVEALVGRDSLVRDDRLLRAVRVIDHCRSLCPRVAPRRGLADFGPSYHLRRLTGRRPFAAIPSIQS